MKCTSLNTYKLKADNEDSRNEWIYNIKKIMNPYIEKELFENKENEKGAKGVSSSTQLSYKGIPFPKVLENNNEIKDQSKRKAINICNKFFGCCAIDRND